MEWIERLVFLVGGATLGWILGVARDRLAAVRAQQITVMTQLHERVLEVARKELSDGKSRILAVGVQGGTKRRRTSMDSEEVE